MGVTIQSLYHWKKRFGGMDVADAKRLTESWASARRAQSDWSAQLEAAVGHKPLLNAFSSNSIFVFQD
jgi:hypothetical protein